MISSLVRQSANQSIIHSFIVSVNPPAKSFIQSASKSYSQSVSPNFVGSQKKPNHGMITLADKKKLQKLATKMNPPTPQSLRQEHFVLKKLANKTYKRYKNQLEFQPKRRILETNKQNSKKWDVWRKFWYSTTRLDKAFSQPFIWRRRNPIEK